MMHPDHVLTNRAAVIGKCAMYNRFLLFVAGLGGLLYGVDVGIIGGALPYLEATSRLNAQQLSIIVAAVLLGSVISSLVAGLLADWMGRRPLMIISGMAFVLSSPIIALSHGYSPLFFGRLLQGISGGLIGLVVPLYLAECLQADIRGKGTGIFQWLLTLGIVTAALAGIYYSYRVVAIQKAADAATVFAFKDHAWRRIFWMPLFPGVLFVFGSFFLEESPRWLFTRGKKELAYAALRRSRTEERANAELGELEQTAAASAATGAAFLMRKESLIRRKYLLPFALACVLLVCQQATGVNSIIAYDTSMLLQSGLSDLSAHWGYVILTVINFLFTIIGVAVVDRKGRRFLIALGAFGITLALIGAGTLFRNAERMAMNCSRVIQSHVQSTQTLMLPFNSAVAHAILAASGYKGDAIKADHSFLVITYSYGSFTSVTNVVRTDESGAAPIRITRGSGVPNNELEAFLKRPFANLQAARTAPLKIQKAMIGGVPSARHGWIVAMLLYVFMAFYSLGPGICGWLILSELMPTRIRSVGMSIALVLNQLTSTVIAGLFLPFVSNYGYSTIFYCFAVFTVIYLIAITFFLPETKGKTLEEIEAIFSGSKQDLRVETGQGF